MGKNHNGGKKQKGQKNSNQVTIIKLDEIRPNNVDTFVGVITKTLGNKRFDVMNIELNVTVQATIPGSTRTRFAVNDYVLLQTVEGLSGANAFLLHKYSSDELTALDVKRVIQNADGSIDINAEEDEIFDFDAI